MSLLARRSSTLKQTSLLPTLSWVQKENLRMAPRVRKSVPYTTATGWMRSVSAWLGDGAVLDLSISTPCVGTNKTLPHP